MSPLATGGGQLSMRAECHTAWPGSGRVEIRSMVMVCGQPKWDIHPSIRSVGRVPQCQLWCLGWRWLLASGWKVDCSEAIDMCSLLTLEGAMLVLCGFEGTGCWQHKVTQWSNCVTGDSGVLAGLATPCPVAAILLVLNYFCWHLIIEPLHSSECFPATIVIIVLEVRCRYSAWTKGRWGCRGLRWLASTWLSVGGSHTTNHHAILD